MSDALLPRVTTRVTPIRPRHRALADFTRTAADEVAMPAVRQGGRVSVEVGAGLTERELPKLAAIAEQLRHAKRVEIIGSSSRAVDSARLALLDLWKHPLPTAAPSGLGGWADLLIARGSNAS